MLNKLLEVNQKNNSVNEFLTAVGEGIPSAIFGVTEAFKAYLASELNCKALVLTKDSLSAGLLAELIKEFSGKKVVYLPAKDETLLTSRAFSRDRQYARVLALENIKNAEIIITTPDALMQSCPKKVCSLTLKKGEDYNPNTLIKELVKMGYARVDSVETQGVFSMRGDILDLFPIGEDCPFRIDFFGDSIDEIKKFEIESRKSLERVESLKIVQAVELVFDEKDKAKLRVLIDKELSGANREQRVRLSQLASDATNALDNDNHAYLANYAGVSDNSGLLFDFLDENSVIVIDEAKRVYELAELLEKEFVERLKALVNAGEVFAFQSLNQISLEELMDKLKGYKISAMQALSTAVPFLNPLKIINPNVGGIADYQLDFKEVFSDVDNWLRSGYDVVVSTATLKRAQDFSLELSSRGIASTIDVGRRIKGVNITTKKLTKGFVFHEEKLAVIGSGNLYAKPTAKATAKGKKQAFFSAPETGDYCVHETYGVGKVLGSKKISSTEGTKDYIAVEYAGGDILYISVEQMDILTRYLGSEKNPKLSKIGGKDFERVKSNVKESIKKMSFDLKQLYKEREELKGFKFTCDQELQKVFEGSFPFEDTPDQILANVEIEKDMTSARVMDRLVCGDVGFGKTEVAFRAIFRAIVNGKQAVMLAPTTILTEQHFNTACQRFKDFGVKIACLNRFKTPKQQKQILDGVKNGEIDFVIGTHRLLSKDVEFKDLGILVLDEEQRFGVEHKEKIKLLKKNVDTLTLTATPIPRTLHMSLSGIRAISTINTPPKKRLPVQTYVTEQTDTLICDAVMREINRGGQAFMLYNRVDSIYAFSERIKKLLPNVKITVVHGQMDERALERNILSFYNGESDLLISTTIIENGIDLPKANTLIVIDADKLGLSTLYQLKGRVGRSDRLAYAYFTFQRDKILSNTAFERLNAIIEFTEMGSGIKIAMRDLEIRGAGNILGAQQHGHMDKIGYELYSKLLKEELTGVTDIVPELDIRVTAYIPDGYVESNTRRMDAYKEIAEISSLKEESEFVSSIIEVYGALPEETENLINIAVVKMLATKLKVSKIIVNQSLVALVFNDFNALSNDKIHRALSEFEGSARLSMAQEPTIEFEKKSSSNGQMLGILREFLVLTAE